MSEAKLNHLLSESRNFGCEYQDALSNHLPMALIALNRINASDDQQWELNFFRLREIYL